MKSNTYVTGTQETVNSNFVDMLFGAIFYHLVLFRSGSSIDIEVYDNGNNGPYTWEFLYPQSCTCAETGVSLASCSLFKCDCLCDSTAGKCDYNCCCDPDCSIDQVL